MNNDELYVETVTTFNKVEFGLLLAVTRAFIFRTPLRVRNVKTTLTMSSEV